MPSGGRHGSTMPCSMETSLAVGSCSKFLRRSGGGQHPVIGACTPCPALPGDPLGRPRTLTGDAHKGLLALGGAGGAPCHALAPVLLQPEDLLHLLAGDFDAHLHHGQPWDGRQHVSTGHPGKLPAGPRPRATPEKDARGSPRPRLLPGATAAEPALTSAAVGAVLRDVVALVHPLAVALEVDLGGGGGAAGQAHRLVLHDVHVLGLQQEAGQQVRGRAGHGGGHGRALLSTCRDTGARPPPGPPVTPSPVAASPTAASTAAAPAAPPRPRHPSARGAARRLRPLNPRRSLMSALSANEKEM